MTQSNSITTINHRILFFPVKLCEKNDLWKPLLLIIPLRLGLSEINPIYIKGLKKSFEIPGTVGLGK